MKGRRIPVIYCDSAGNEYFTDVLTVPVLTLAEVDALRAEANTYANKNFLSIQGGGSAGGPTPFGSFFSQSFPTWALDIPWFCHPKFFQNCPIYNSLTKLVFRAHNVWYLITNHIPYTEAAPGWQPARTWTFYIKDLDGNKFGPVSVNCNYTDRNYTTPSVFSFPSNTPFFCASGSDYNNADVSNSSAYFKFAFSYYIENDQGQLIFCKTDPNSLTVGGSYPSGIPGATVDRLFPRSASSGTDPWTNFFRVAAGNTVDPVDPYSPGGTSEPTDPGDYDGTQPSDTVDVPDPPTYSFADSGFCRIYNPTLTELRSLSNYLWTDTTFLQTLLNHAKQLLEDPMEAVISLNMLPVSITDVGTAVEVKVMYIGTGVYMNPVNSQFVQVNCGTIFLKEKYASALDYNPYTKISLFLPFIGTVELNPDEVMNHTLGVKYNIDIVTGSCVAFVTVDGSTYYQYSGNCAVNMPLNSADFSGWISASIAAATALVGGATAGATGAAVEATAPPAAAAGSEALVTESQAAEMLRASSEGSMIASNAGKLAETRAKQARFEEFAKKAIPTTVNAVVGSKRGVEHTGHFSGYSGVLGVKRPYVIWEYPRMCNPEEYGKYNGRPSMIYKNLGSLKGYTEVQEIHLTGFSATNPELSEIASLLKAGVIL